MKLEGWIAISGDKTTWIACDTADLVERAIELEGMKRIFPDNPIPCTLTIPDESEVEDGNKD
jgi:hypothetical protein